MTDTTLVRILDRQYLVSGYRGEGWFEILRKQGTADGAPGYNVNGLRALVDKDAICIDVGASYGLVTLALAQLCPQGRIYAFEPDNFQFRALLQTLEDNDIMNVEAHPGLIGRDCQEGDFIIDQEWRSSCHFVPRKGGEALTQSIDSLAIPHVDFIKIDAEGSELDILFGARKTLDRDHPAIMLEFNSFAFVHYRNSIPRHVLTEILLMFPRVRYFDRTKNSALTDIADPEAFLRQNMLTGYVDDLVCTWETP